MVKLSNDTCACTGEANSGRDSSCPMYMTCARFAHSTNGGRISYFVEAPFKRLTDKAGIVTVTCDFFIDAETGLAAGEAEVEAITEPKKRGFRDWLFGR